MKALVTTAVAFASATQIAAQGDIYFANRDGRGDFDAPVFDVDCTTLLAGDAYLAQAYVGLSADSLAPVGLPDGFLTGRYAGYISGQIVTVPAIGTVYFQMRAWEAAAGSTYEEAVINKGAFGASTPILMQAILPPGGPGLPIGLESFCLVPEPSPLALGLLGFAVLWLGGGRPHGTTAKSGQPQGPPGGAGAGASGGIKTPATTRPPSRLRRAEWEAQLSIVRTDPNGA